MASHQPRHIELEDVDTSQGGWPAVGWEEHTWHPALLESDISRTEARRQTGPYLAALPAPIASLQLDLPPDVVAELSEASSKIVRFDAEMGDDIAPFSAILLRSESVASSQIEHLTASARAIGLVELGENSGRNAAEIVANTRAMQAAIDLSGHLDTTSMLTMHRSLMEHRPDIAGQWRHQQVWIGAGYGGPCRADFVPPHHAHVPALIEDLIAFVARDDIAVLAQAAVAHAQFETIHPFVDGNGRVGRALMQSLFRNKGLTENVTVPVSAGLLADPDAYVGALGRYRQGDPAEIVSLVSAATFRALGNGRQLVNELRHIRAAWDHKINARSDSAVWRVADLLLRQPIVNHGVLGRELGSANPDRYLRQIEHAGVITEFSGKRRNRLWIANEVITALDDFATRAGQRP